MKMKTCPSCDEDVPVAASRCKHCFHDFNEVSVKNNALLPIMAGLAAMAVIGAGTMGAGIAQVCAQAGWDTRLYDAFPDGLERGMERIDAFWEKGIARGKTTPEQRETWSANLAAVSDLAAAVADVDLVIEAVPELPELKQHLSGNGSHR